MLQKRSIALPGHVLLAEVADCARAAVRVFVQIEHTSAAMESWLHGPYRDATRFGPRRMITPAATHDEARPEPSGVAGIVAGAQQEVTAAIEAALRAHGAADLVRRLPPVVHIVPAHDVSGARGFIPIDAQGGRLADRVVALVLADYLTRPGDFIARAELIRATPVPPVPPTSGERRTLPNAPTEPEMQAVRVK